MGWRTPSGQVSKGEGVVNSFKGEDVLRGKEHQQHHGTDRPGLKLQPGAHRTMLQADRVIRRQMAGEAQQGAHYHEG